MRRWSLLAVLALSALACSSGPSSPRGDGGGNPGPTGGGWLAGGSGLLASTEDGLTFTTRQSPTTSDLYSLVCVNHLIGWAAGASGTVIHTVDGGQTWARQSTPTTVSLRAVHFADANL